MPPPSHPELEQVVASRRPGAVHDLLDEVDVALVVARQPPWQFATLQAALTADLSPEWCGGVYVVDDGAAPASAQAARTTLADHHPLARRTILTLPRRLGTAGAANLAFAEATGEYVALLDAATRPAPGTLRRLTVALEADHDALWAATTTPGCAVLRRRGFLDLGGFDPDLRGAIAVGELARRARIEGWNLLSVEDAHADRDARPLTGRPRPRWASRPSAAAQARPWSGGALALWLPRARRTARRDDLA
jgi:hypothetical protein